MIIRESPASKRPGKAEPWPPRSPHEALLSSPSRRKRLQADRDVSPTPTKRRRLDFGLEGDHKSHQREADDEDDEETLQLRLQEIQAKLKIKKLQKSKEVKLRSESDDAHVEVPVSPPKQRPRPPPESPHRIQLGIDKGLRATDVSLKKARVERRGEPEPEIVERVPKRPTIQPIKSFSERLAESRHVDSEKQAKRARADNVRSKTFGVEFQLSTWSVGKQSPPLDANCRGDAGMRQESSNPRYFEALEESSAEKDPASGLSLSKRLSSQKLVQEALHEKTVYSIPRLLKTVTSPDYEVPDEENYVVIGIIASKTEPHNHKQQLKQSSNSEEDDTTNRQKSKFMVMRLVDLEWELDLFLFDTGFDKFWKLTVGTVIAILNPGVMPPKPHMRDTGKFSLKLCSSEDQVLEIGMSNDLSWCKSVKRDGKQCGQWIDKRRTDYCEFHVNLQIERARSGRMEINGMSGMSGFLNKPQAGSARGGARTGQSGRGGSRGAGHIGGRLHNNGLKTEGEYYDRNAHERAYLVPKEFRKGSNAAALLDREDYVQNGLSSKERHQKRLQDRERERDLAKKLSSQGIGMGAEYSRLKNDEINHKTSQRSHPQFEEGEDAVSLGLVNANAVEVHLSPVKGRRSAKTSSSAVPMGWGNAYKRGLPSPVKVSTGSPLKTAFKDKQQISPSKSTRFVLEKKGIRQPGRDSLPQKSDDHEDDDDGLDIV